MLNSFKQWGLSSAARAMLKDPVHKNFYCFKVIDDMGDVLISSVMCHNQYLIFQAGLRQKVVTGEVSHFEIIARGDEDSVAEEKYLTEKRLKVHQG